MSGISHSSSPLILRSATNARNINEPVISDCQVLSSTVCPRVSLRECFMLSVPD